MFSSEIFGLGERLGCILNLSHSFDAIEASLNLLVFGHEAGSPAADDSGSHEASFGLGRTTMNDTGYLAVSPR